MTTHAQPHSADVDEEGTVWGSPKASELPPASKPTKPKDSPPSKRKRRTSSTSKATDAEIRTAIDAIFVGVGSVWSSFDPHCGFILIDRGPKVTDALVAASKDNPRLREALASFVTASTWGAVISAGMMVAVPIAAHHGLLPETTLSLVGLTDEEKAHLGLADKAEDDDVTTADKDG